MTHLPMSSSVILCMQYFLPLALNPLVTFKNTNNCQRLSSFISNTFQYIMLDMCHSLGTAVEPVIVAVGLKSLCDVRLYCVAPIRRRK